MYKLYYIGNARNSSSTNFIPITLKIVLVEFVLVETVLVGAPLYSMNMNREDRVTNNYTYM